MKSYRVDFNNVRKDFLQRAFEASWFLLWGTAPVLLEGGCVGLWRALMLKQVASKGLY